MGKKTKQMDNKKEVTVEIRESGVSIQGAGIGNNQDDARETLQKALDALDSQRERDAFRNEIFVKDKK